MRTASRHSVHLHAAFFDERLNARAAQFGKLRGEEAVQALAGFFGGDHEFQMFGEIVVSSAEFVHEIR